MYNQYVPHFNIYIKFDLDHSIFARIFKNYLGPGRNIYREVRTKWRLKTQQFAF